MSKRPTTSMLTLPGLGPHLHTINRLWNITNVAGMILFDLHPQEEHNLNNWRQDIISHIEKIARITQPDDVPWAKEVIVDMIHHRLVAVRPNGRFWVTLSDLKNAKMTIESKQNKKRKREEQEDQEEAP